MILRRSLRPLSLVLLSMLAGCAAHRTQSAPEAPAAAAQRDDVNAVVWMQTATEWQAATRQTFRVATATLRQSVEHLTFLHDLDPKAAPGGAAAFTQGAFADAVRQQQAWNALVPQERGKDEALEPLAVVVDVDETVLDNTPYQVRNIRAGSSYDEPSWDAWCYERKARAIPGAREFAQYAAANGVAMFYITNRKAHLRDATADNLRAQGFPVAGDNSNVLPRDDARGWTRDKGSRRRLVDQTHRIVVMLGDNLGDFVDGAYTDNATRTRLLDEYDAWWGERWFMLPNPAYGSWEDAATRYCKDAALAADARACKLSQLRAD